MYTQLLKPVLSRVYNCAVEEVKHSVQKEQRIIDTLEPVMSTHRLVIDQKLITHDYDTSQKDIKYSLFYQMTRITRDRGALIHDDRLDALAMAVGYWTAAMAKDNDKAVDSMRNEVLKKELKSFMNHIVGNKTQSKPRGWMGNNSGIRRTSG